MSWVDVVLLALIWVFVGLAVLLSLAQIFELPIIRFEEWLDDRKRKRSKGRAS